MYLWSLILPDYALRRRGAISALSTSRLPSDIDVNSEAISGLLEDLEVALFRLIHRLQQTVRLLWLALFNPRFYRAFAAALLAALSFLAASLRSLVALLADPAALARRRRERFQQRYQRWSEARARADKLLQDYFGTLEARRPPTLVDMSEQPVKQLELSESQQSQSQQSQSQSQQSQSQQSQPQQSHQSQSQQSQSQSQPQQSQSQPQQPQQSHQSQSHQSQQPHHPLHRPPEPPEPLELLTKSMLGYPLEEYSVHTSDHYCLVLFRIPRPETRRVVLLQHGVMDTALAWIADKPALSLAIQAYVRGYDVFFGSTRGTDGHYASGRRRHEMLDVRDKEYWDFDIDDLILDYRAFVQSIYVIKERERREGKRKPRDATGEFRVEFKGEVQATEFRALDEAFLHREYTLQGISHSMGGAVTLAYIAESILSHTAHHLSKVVLLSPAGFLADQSLIVRVVMALSPLFVTERSAPSPFPTRSSAVHLLVAKVLQDMQSSPATLELVNRICAMVIGGEPQDWPFQKVNYTRYPLGVTSIYVMLQFRQWYEGDQFTAYDYGEKGNLLRYGKKTPIRFTDFYDQFDLPVHFVAGKYDCIVPSTQVFRHYQILKDVLKERTSYVEFKNAGHLQFTIGLDHDVISYVLDKLDEGDVQGYHGLETEKRPPQCLFGFTKVDANNRSYDVL